MQGQVDHLKVLKVYLSWFEEQERESVHPSFVWHSPSPLLGTGQPLPPSFTGGGRNSCSGSAREQVQVSQQLSQPGVKVKLLEGEGN